MALFFERFLLSLVRLRSGRAKFDPSKTRECSSTVLSTSSTTTTYIIRVSLDKVESGSPNLKTAHAARGGEHKEYPSPSTEGRNVADAERSC